MDVRLIILSAARGILLPFLLYYWIARKFYSIHHSEQIYSLILFDLSIMKVHGNELDNTSKEVFMNVGFREETHKGEEKVAFWKIQAW